MRCPLICNQHGTPGYCQEGQCAFADEAGQCLVKQALQCYVSAERTRIAEENDRLRRETELAKTYWAMKKDGTRSPIQFLEGGDTTPYTPPAGIKLDIEDIPKIDAYTTPVPGGITYAHVTPTEKYPHGGWFEAPYYDDGRPKTVID